MFSCSGYSCFWMKHWNCLTLFRVLSVDLVWRSREAELIKIFWTRLVSTFYTLPETFLTALGSESFLPPLGRNLGSGTKDIAERHEVESSDWFEHRLSQVWKFHLCVFNRIRWLCYTTRRTATADWRGSKNKSESENTNRQKCTEIDLWPLLLSIVD